MSKGLSINIVRNLPKSVSLIKFLLILLFLSVCHIFFPNPLFSKPSLRIENEIPYGSKNNKVIFRGAIFSVLICVENLEDSKLFAQFFVKFPSVLEPIDPKDGKITILREKDGWLVKSNIFFSAYGERWFEVLKIKVSKSALSKEYIISSFAKIKGCSKEIKSIEKIFVLSEGEMKKSVRIEKITIPSDEFGKIDERMRKNTFLIKGGKRFYEKLFSTKGTEMKDFFPATYVGVTIRSDLSYPATFLLTLDILNGKGEKVRGFESPYMSEKDIEASSAAYKMINIKGKSKKSLTIPIYTNADIITPGIYNVKLKLKLFGTEKPVTEKSVKVEVSERRWMPISFSLLSLFITFLGFFIFYMKKELLFEMKVKDLITISLFGSMMFATINIPGTILFNFAHILLGPFSFLLTGIFYEVIFYIFVCSLVTLVPKPGALGLSILIRFFLAGFCFGEFSPLSILYYSNTAFILEYSFHLLDTYFGRERHWIISAIVLGIADAFITLIFFNLSMLFYRLFYARWYILTYVFLNGFLFTAVSVPFGLRLGKRLSEVYTG